MLFIIECNSILIPISMTAFEGENYIKPSVMPTEKNKQESGNRYRIFFEQSRDAIYIRDKDGKIIDFNESMLDLFKYNREEMATMNIINLYFNSEDLYRFKEALIPRGFVHDYELKMRKKDGSQIDCLVSSTLLRADNGSILGYQGIIRDITKRKQAEETLARKVQELARSNAELEQFAYVASHDLQEPLRMVTSYVQLLARRYKGKLDADADEFIAYAVDGATRMQQLINDLLTYSRVSTRGRAFEPTDCEAVLTYALANLEVAIKESGAIITHKPLPSVLADGRQLEAVFQNLIGNAIKFRSEAAPRVHISAEQKENEWVFAISDNGIGIEADFSGRIFVIFQRLHSRSEYPGTGIGLAICKKIVERHGGRIWLESEPGKGTTFYFTIPVKEASNFNEEK